MPLQGAAENLFVAFIAAIYHTLKLLSQTNSIHADISVGKTSDESGRIILQLRWSKFELCVLCSTLSVHACSYYLYSYVCFSVCSCTVSLHMYTADYFLHKLADQLGQSSGPDLAGGRPGAPGGRPGPSGVFGISERDWLSNYRVLKIEGFGGRPPVGGRTGARGPPSSPLNPALAVIDITDYVTNNSIILQPLITNYTLEHKNTPNFILP